MDAKQFLQPKLFGLNLICYSSRIEELYKRIEVLEDALKDECIKNEILTSRIENLEQQIDTILWCDIEK